jgi:hypothetical protein
VTRQRDRVGRPLGEEEEEEEEEQKERARPRAWVMAEMAMGGQRYVEPEPGSGSQLAPVV